ncbi:hypothetical protein FOZ62_010220, partial [Perkinsus olseni]
LPYLFVHLVAMACVMLPVPGGAFTDSYFLIELQGSIRSPDGRFDGKVLGNLTLNAALGILRLPPDRGRMEPLKKHLLVFRPTDKRVPYFSDVNSKEAYTSQVHEVLG